MVLTRLSFKDLLENHRLAAMMALVIGISLGTFIMLRAYRSGLSAEFANLAPDLLAVQESQSFGEIYGSRLSAKVGQQLLGLGLSLVVPEIHEVTGTSIQNAVLLRGVDLLNYTRIQTFTLTAGRHLLLNDSPRLTMIGSRLAENQKASTGSLLRLRGRDFTVVGIFHTGTYMDNEAWIALPEAQDLLGWGSDVSIYIIPDEGILHEGDTLPGGISIARKGEGSRAVAYQYQPVIDLMGIVVIALGIATALALANILWRLAWLRRKEIAILRTTGFSALSICTYLLIQAVCITLGGILLGSLGALALASLVHLAAMGFTIVPHLDAFSLLVSLGWIILVMLAGSILPAWWLGRLNLAQLLRSE
jgi:putative ABC transport system permease protein